MTQPPAIALLSALPPEVLAFAAEAGVTDYLPAVLEMTRRIFPDVPPTVLVEDDPEIANDRHIVFQVDVTALNDAQLDSASQQWMRELFDHCPSTHVPVFRLGMVADE
jgi:hypothetical protein